MQDGLRIMEEACKAVEDRITGIGGAFNFHMKPKVVTATDEADLAKQLERAEQENAEVCPFFTIHLTLGRNKNSRIIVY